MRAPAHAGLRDRRRRHGRHRRRWGPPRGGDAERAPIALVVPRGDGAQRDGARGERRGREQAREVQHLRGGGARVERGIPRRRPDPTRGLGGSHAAHPPQRHAPRESAAPVAALPERQAAAQRGPGRVLPAALRLGRGTGRQGGHRAHVPEPHVEARRRGRARAVPVPGRPNQSRANRRPGGAVLLREHASQGAAVLGGEVLFHHVVLRETGAERRGGPRGTRCNNNNNGEACG